MRSAIQERSRRLHEPDVHRIRRHDSLRPLWFDMTSCGDDSSLSLLLIGYSRELLLLFRAVLREISPIEVVSDKIPSVFDVRTWQRMNRPKLHPRRLTIGAPNRAAPRARLVLYRQGGSSATALLVFEVLDYVAGIGWMVMTDALPNVGVLLLCL
jgi:hypothetical protein